MEPSPTSPGDHTPVLIPLVKLEPLEEFEEQAWESTKETADETAEELNEELAKGLDEELIEEPTEEPADGILTRDGRAQRRVLGGLLDMLAPDVKTKKRKGSAFTMDRSWKRPRGNLLQSAPPQNPLNPFLPAPDPAGAYLPPGPVTNSHSRSVPVADDDDDADFHTADSVHAPLDSSQPTGEEEVPHGDGTTTTQSTLTNPTRRTISSLDPSCARMMNTPPGSSSRQARGIPSSSAPFISSNPDSTMDQAMSPVDHRGHPLSPAAITAAREYWKALRQFELCPIGSAVMPSVDLLVRMAQNRQTYTQLILGLDQVAPGTRTFEPPNISPPSLLPTASASYVNSSMDINRATGAGPNNPSEVSGYGSASVPAPDDTVYNHVGNSGRVDAHNNRSSPSHRTSPNQHPHNPDSQNSAISSNYETDNPSPPSGSDSDVFADADAGPAPDMVPIDPDLSEEQKHVVELAASGKNIFYTGSAGSGKSTVLHAIRKRLEAMGKTVRVMAPTGKVALAINGCTTWTFAGWIPASYQRGIDNLKEAAKKNRNTKKRFCDTDVIIIDEISMVENLHLERLNQIMRAGRASLKKNAENLPFGGVQVIVTGDFFQLPPIGPFSHCLCGNPFTKRAVHSDNINTCSNCYLSFVDNEKWAFKSKTWEDCKFVHIELSTVHRQRDPEFIAMLQKCRKGIKFTPREVDLLMNHPSVTPFALKLFSTREEVRRTNDEGFRALDRPPHSYLCYDEFLSEAKHRHLNYKGDMNNDGTLVALKDHRFEPKVELKRGMPVVLLVNDLTTGLANGSQGVIAGFEPYDASHLPLYVGHSDRTAGGQLTTYPDVKNAHIRAHAEQQRRGLAWPVVKFFCGITRIIYPTCHIVEVGDSKPYSLMCRTQLPLAAGYAMSIHRAQGLTLDRVIVDLSRVFEDGQVYVALSRATCLKGLKIEGNSKGLIVGKGNKEVQKFMKEKFGM